MKTETPSIATVGASRRVLSEGRPPWSASRLYDSSLRSIGLLGMLSIVACGNGSSDDAPAEPSTGGGSPSSTSVGGSPPTGGAPEGAGDPGGGLSSGDGGSAPTCEPLGSSAASSSECCSAQLDDFGQCCSGMGCCAAVNHSHGASDGYCHCDDGYEWASDV